MSLFLPEIRARGCLIILHGLFGSSDNWSMKALSQDFEVFLIDLRNLEINAIPKNNNYNLIEK